MNLQAIDKFHKTRVGYAVFGIVELVMAYGFVDWALDSGALWWWIAAAILLLGAVENAAKFIGTFVGRHRG
jgi:hypothetical protein